jgi:hypothetical protein
MSEETSPTFVDRLNKLGNLITPIGVIILLMLQAQFVSRSEFNTVTEKFGNRVESLEKIIVQMSEAAKVNDRQDTLIADHERRIRDLEHFHQ